MEAVNENRFGRWLGAPSRAGWSDRGSGPERELWSLRWGEHPTPLASQLLLETWAWVFLKARQGLVTGHLQPNSTFMTSCHSLTLSTPCFYPVCFCFSSFSLSLSPLCSLKMSPSKHSQNLSFISQMLVAVLRKNESSPTPSTSVFNLVLLL